MGTRLRPITYSVSKCMVPVAGKPFVEHLISRLVKSGVRDFILAVGYLAGQVQAYLGDGSKWQCRIRYSIEDPPRGTGGALDQAKDLLSDEFLFLNGDNLVHLDYLSFIQFFHKHPDWIGAMTVFSDDYGKFRKNAAWDQKLPVIQAYDYENPAGKNFVDSGAKIFRKAVLKYLPKKQDFSLEKEVLSLLAKEGKLGAYQVQFAPLEIGNHDQLKEAEEALK